MKSAQIALFLLTATLACAAQSAESQKGDANARVAAARCQYTPADTACKSRQDDPPRPAATEQHIPRRCGAGPCSRPAPHSYPYPAHPPVVFAPENGTHAAAGALIGFGLAGGLGASRDGDARGRAASALFFGSLGALMGAVIGHSIPSHSFRHHYERDEDLEDDVAVRVPRPVSAENHAKPQPAPDRPSVATFGRISAP